MTPERWRQVLEVFDAALLREQGERRSYVEAVCAPDDELARAVHSLLLANDHATGFAGAPIMSAGSALAAADVFGPYRIDGETTSTRVGPYRILDRLGEGGMGVVYLAEQDQPFRRRVALKVIKIGMDTREVVARFEAERQALALMDHPSIASVYDAGATPEGRPYFAMEYVAGIPMTEYCDKHRLSMAARLELFVRVCGAIQHAHQKGIIHRDIKPSNILVTLQDGKPVPKIIDFGVAKAIHQRLTEKTLFTQHGTLIGTPAYMSPEQAEMSALNVDTTTDIYSLGVVLYELLIGALPFDPQYLRGAGYGEIQRIIRDEEPPRPSARLCSLQATATLVALQRQMPLRTLVRELKGDLDWITLKAMDKERTRRYASASELAADIGRHLNMEPVNARPPAMLYRAAKFVRKYKTAVIAVTLGVTLSAVVSTAAQTQSVVRQTVLGRIEQAEFIQSGVLRSAQSAISEMRIRQAARVDNPTAPWTGVVKNHGLRLSLMEALYARSITTAAICDTAEQVVIAAYSGLTRCPAGRPASDLNSITVLSVLRGTIPSKTTDYVLSMPLVDFDGSELGSVRVVLSPTLMAVDLSFALSRAIVSCVIQIVGVVFAAAIASWFVFRRA